MTISTCGRSFTGWLSASGLLCLVLVAMAEAVDKQETGTAGAADAPNRNVAVDSFRARIEDTAGVSIIKIDGKTAVTFIDGAGRRVSLPYPLMRVAAASGSYGPETILALDAKDRLVGVGDYAKKYTLHIAPLLRDIPGIGLKRPSAEKILEIAPQAVIFYECYYPYPENLMNVMRNAGIGAIMMDFHRPEVFERHIRIMGKILDRSERAEELIAFEKKYLGMIAGRVSRVPAEKRPRVYLEQYQEYRTVTPSHPDFILLRNCGGNNVCRDLSPSLGTTAFITSEKVVEQNPDIIIKHVSTNRVHTGGYAARGTEELEQVRNGIMKRPGWEKVSAVRSGRVYVLNTETKATHPSVYCSYIARWLYPERFKDLDAVGVYREWMERFLNVPYKGIYAFPEKPVGGTLPVRTPPAESGAVDLFGYYGFASGGQTALGHCTRRSGCIPTVLPMSILKNITVNTTKNGSELPGRGCGFIREYR